jgi:hypothetical protein
LLEKAIPKIIKKRGKMINDKFNKSIKRWFRNIIQK